MKTAQLQYPFSISKVMLALLTVAGLLALAPLPAQAGNVGWAVSVGGGHGGYGGYGGGWRPAAYGPGYGGGWGPGWRGGYYGPGYGYPYAGAYYAPPVVYAAPPVVSYAAPQQPMVLASQPQAPVWYYCEASGQYFPYVQSCSSGWQTQPAMPPSGSAPTRQQRQN
ncbi:hypothetical protein [Polynucleobacter sp. AP-Sving-400A-A2]|uniref:hypothetical protein n=1 Tax=Polynucleobacter sp. AP-Sving-400A-A2 TaxID=2081049 RepID=UPI001BFDF8CD|nr:hypothetical protein [Polynucleobacter sp. AP-Sving-400A-A2]QWE13786.1 hypothetical protein C2758_06235 [Polynucleobacter sp. AP-Sving-400A-A2]